MLLRNLGLDEDAKIPDYLQDTKLLCYRDISDDLLAQSQAEDTEGLYKDIFYNNHETGITDTGIFFFPCDEGGSVKHHQLWEDIESVEAADEVIIFHGKKDIALPAISVCDEELIENEKDFKTFIDMLDHMANPDRKDKPITASNEEKTEKDNDIRNPESRADNVDTKPDKPMFNEFDITVTQENIGKILAAGKSRLDGNVDASILQKLKEKEKELASLLNESKGLKPSPEGTAQDIRSMLEKIADKRKMMKLAIINMETSEKKWEENIYPLFIKACCADVRITYTPSGYSVAKAGNTPTTRAGVYIGFGKEKIEERRDTGKLSEDMAKDLLEMAESLKEFGQKYALSTMHVWEEMSRIKALGKIKPQASFESVFMAATSRLKTAEKNAQAYENNQAALKQARQDVDKFSKQADEFLSRIIEIDPVLTAFSRPGADYDSKWIEAVQKAAGTREAMPYLPLYWDMEHFGTVFDWQKAVEAGRPNFFIEAATDEGIEGRTDMLDNFVATMLLAFPIKQVHFTVLEYSPVNTFVGKMLPEKVCEVFDVQSDTDAIKSFKNRIKDLYSSTRDVADCCPHEIVIISGFGKRDRVFTDLMNQMKPIIENGRRSGIYFAVVLSEDITKYDWKDADANEFEQFFTPYSTILTSKKDKSGNPVPEYALLQNREAVIETEDGTEQGSLAELIAAYAEKGASSVPNKVYGPIESGELYKSKPITDLDNQPKKDVGKLVVPIAESESGDEINLQFDDKDYISCFILGRSGMGKSYTLHTILTNMMLKYDPSTVEFILMDFKPGGVEMNYYKDVPHVKSLLVNGADRQVAGEILMSIDKEMTRRGEVFQQCGVSSIGRYNTYAAKNGLEPMKHVVMLVDECQDLFKVENPNSDTNIVTDIARKGRSYGIHMVLATQTLQKTDIPGDALAQFSDFLFMGCKDDDVMKCEIKDREVIKAVGQLVRGEVIYCHRSSAPVHGYVYNFAGKGDVYKEKTLKNLLSSRFTHPKEKQFYFNASQIYRFDESELKALKDAAESGMRPIPMSVLGKNLSVKADSLYAKFGRSDGANLLVLGSNNQLQGERVLWNAAVSVYDCNKAIGQNARYYIVPNIPEEVDAEARAAHSARMEMLKTFARRKDVNLVEEEERAEIIERVAATVRGRQALAETDRNAVKDLDSIYLIIPNQQLFSNKMARRPKGVESLDDNIVTTSAEPTRSAEESASASDSFQSLGFADIDMNFDTPATSSRSSANSSTAAPGRDLDEELRLVLEYGPAVNVHVLMQTTAPDKIYSGDSMREKEMTLLFNDIVFMKMLQAGSLSLPVDPRHVEQLSVDPKSLRAIVYNGSRGERTVIPFDFPILKK